MNLLLIDTPDLLPDGRACIKGRRFMHMKKVLKAEAGSILACGRVNGPMGTGIVDTMTKHEAVISLNLDQEPPAPLPLTLILALPRPKMLKRILQTAASLGVKEIYLINSWRVEKSFWHSDLLTPDKLDSHLRLGLEQAKDTILPKIHLKRYFTSFVKEELPVLAKGKHFFLAHPKADQPCPVGVNDDTVLVIGPEGGFIDLEVQTLADAGAGTFHMGPRILRVETAVPALISRLFTL